MAKLTKEQRKDALVQSGQAAGKWGLQGATLGMSVSPVGSAIGAGAGVLVGGIGGYLRARRELLNLQKIEKAQQKINKRADEASSAELRRQQGALAKEFDTMFPPEAETSTLGMISPGISNYDAYHARRYG